MLAIRLKRTGRRGHAQFRVIVQDSHFHPTRGRIVAYLGSYNPHTKTAQIDKDVAAKYLGNGAQPSDRVARLLKSEGVKLPDWVKLDDPKKRSIRNPEKLRRNRPAEPAAPAAEPVAEAESTPEEAPTDATQEVVAEETAAETTEVPAEETPVAEDEPTAEESSEPATDAPA